MRQRIRANVLLVGTVQPPPPERCLWCGEPFDDIELALRSDNGFAYHLACEDAREEWLSLEELLKDA